MIKDKLYRIANGKQNANSLMADYILNYSKPYTSLSAKEIATNCYVVNSYVTKFIKSLEFDNFEEFKIAIYLEHKSRKDDPSYKDYVINQYANEVLSSLIMTANKIDINELDLVSQKIFDAEQIILYGIGGSAIVCEDLYLKLLKRKYNVHFPRDEHIRHCLVDNTNKQTVLLIFSYANGDMHSDLDPLLSLAKEKNTTTCLVSSNKDQIARYDNFIEVGSTQSGMRNFSITSRTSMQMVSDLLFIKLLNLQEQ